MNNATEDFCRIPVWYPALANHTFITSFTKLRNDEIAALSRGDKDCREAREVIARLSEPMSSFSGNCFVSVDTAAPTDTERFAGKRGAVFSARSAWRYLSESGKIREAAVAGKAKFICIRPFRRMNQTREFRLFIRERRLNAMSQYWLVRHFRRLEGVKQRFWEQAEAFVREIAWVLPEDNIVMDIYFTSSNEILIIDFNPWGDPTSPLLFDDWNRDWSNPAGIRLIRPPVKINGDVNVSF